MKHSIFMRSTTFVALFLFAFLTIDPPIRAADNEDANDTSAGAEMLTAPVVVIAYTIVVSDSDWFQIAKGKCDIATVTFSPIGDPNDIYSLEIHTVTPGGPVLYTAAGNMGNNEIELTFPEEVTSFYVVVKGEDVAGTSTYNLNIRTASKNAPALAQIKRLKKLIKKSKGKLKKARKKPESPGRNTRIRKLEKKIKKAQRMIAGLEATLCK